MAPNWISNGTLKTDSGIDNRPFLLQICQKTLYEVGYDILKDLVPKLKVCKEHWTVENQVSSVL